MCKASAKAYLVSLASTHTSETTIKNILVSPKDKDPMQCKSGIIYWYRYDRIDCGEEYIGE